MISFNIELNKGRTKDDLSPRTLLLRITMNRKHARVALMYSVKEKDFNPNGKKSNYIRASQSDHTKINSYIKEKISAAKDIISKLEKDGKPITAKIIKSKLLESKAHDFFLFSDRYITELKSTSQIGTYKKYSAVLQSVKNFVDTDSLAFEEVDVEFLNKYQAHLVEAEKVQTTIHGYLSKIRTLFNIAIQRGELEIGSNPFHKYKLRQGRPSKDRLTEQEIRLLENLDLKEGCLIYNVRNVFLFSFYNAGIRISDILQLTWDNVKGDRLVYKMFKTNKDHSLKLKEKPMAILMKYKGRGESFIFPFFSDKYDYSDPLFLHNQISAKTALINKYLKEVAKLAEINKRITTHTARHTFADIARQKTDNIYNLSKTLGHSSIKVTEAYLASFDQAAVDDTMDKMF